MDGPSFTLRVAGIAEHACSNDRTLLTRRAEQNLFVAVFGNVVGLVMEEVVLN